MATTYSVDGQSFGSIGEVENYLSDQGYSGKYTIEDRRQGGVGTQSGIGMGEGAGLLGMAGGGGSGRLFGGPAPTTGMFAPGGMFGASASPAAAATGKTFMGYGYTDPKTGQWVSPGMDMRDGGGKGRSGDTFQGGPFSGLLNAIGVRPAGYRQRLEDNLAPQTSLRPQMRPAGLLGGTEGTSRAVQAALQAASVGKKSAAQSFSGYPYQIGITSPADVLNAAEAAIVGGVEGEIKTEADKKRLAEVNANAGYAMPLETPQPYTPYSPAPMLASDVITPPMPPLTTTSGVGVARGIDPTPADNPIGRGITTSYLGGRLPFTYGSDGGGARIPTRYMETPDQIALRRDLAQDYGYLSQAQIPPRLGMTNAPYMRKNITLPPNQSGSYYRPTWLNERTGVSLLGGR